MANARKELSGLVKFSEGLKDIGTSLTKYITLPLAALSVGAIKVAGDMQALEKGFAATYKGGEDLGVALAKVKELAKLPGLGLREALQGATNLQAAGFSADLARRALGAFGNALATVGKGKADLDGVGLALGQIASKGKISAEEINQLAERVPQIRQAMQAAFGTADTTALQKMKIDATAFVEGVTAELEKLPKVTGGINNAFENLQDAGSTALAKIGDALNKAFDIEGLLGKFADFISGLADKFAALDPAVQKAVFAIGGIAAAAGPVLAVIGSIGVAVPAIEAGFAVLGTTAAAALGPIAIGAAAVAGAAYLIYDNWSEIVAYFKGPAGDVFRDFAASVGDSISALIDAFKTLANGPIGDVVKELVKLQATFIGLELETAVAVLASGFAFLAGNIRVTADLLSGEFRKAAEDAQKAGEGMAKPFMDLFGAGQKSEVIGGVHELIAELDKLVEVTLMAGGGIAAALGIVEGGGLLERLKEKLKGLKEQVEKDGTETAIANTNRRIEATEKEIARLEKLGKASKALAELRQALALNDKIGAALGADYDVLKADQSALQSGIQSLIKEGYSPASAAVQKYAKLLKELNALMKQVADNEHLAVRPPTMEVPKAPTTLPTVETNDTQLNGQERAFISRQFNINSKFNEALQARAAIQKKHQEELLGNATQFNAEIGPIITAGLNQLAVGIGQALGNALAGTQNLGSALASVLLSTIGSIATQLGELAIGIGIGVAGIRASLKTLNPVAALAAGVALVALGAFASSTASSIASGGASGSASYSSGASRSTDYSRGANVGPAAQQTINVIISGELKASGRDLSLVLKEKDYRQKRIQG